jgi:two-component system chemotaxis sensor kinase CheA
VDLDRMVLEHLKDPLIHIVRNSVDHGIEPPLDREQAGKSRTGTIRIQCALESGACAIRISDDGRGFDYDKIRRKAVATGAYREDEIARVDENALNLLLFTPGFSTKDEVSAVSGRGVGLDIVRHEIESIKGKISVKSAAGQGSEFVLSLPLSLATCSGFFVAVAGQRYLIPSAYIEEILIYRKADEVICMNRRSVLVHDKIVPIYYLGTLLGNAENEDPESYHAVVVEYLGDLIGIIVDEVQQHASIIYKPLPPCLAELKPVQGFVYDENFDMVPILVVPEIVQRFRRSRGIDGKKRFSVDRSEYRRLLVVDDSFSTREIEKSILSMNGYQVETAVDGIEALEMLRAQRFDLIVTDINMPRMDGATLIENVRRDEKYRAVPILVVSSESDNEKRQQLMSLGANGYILKADFDRGNLAQEVRYLLAQSAQSGNVLTSPKTGGD